MFLDGKSVSRNNYVVGVFAAFFGGLRGKPVGAGLPAKAASQPTHLLQMYCDQTVGASLLAKSAL
ncbi:hypothetical protein D9M71_711630 [compost metagenome]